MTAVTPVYYTLEQAHVRRNEILRIVGDEASFKERGARYELDSGQSALYNELNDLEFLIGD